MNSKRTIIWTTVGALTLVILLLAVTGVWAEPSHANLAAPSAPLAVFSDTITFQGRLLDNDGNLVDGSPAMTFRLYTQAEGGAPVWEDAYNVPVEDGLFNAGLAAPSSLFDGQALWLGVQVEGDAQEMAPRQQLLPAPYALYAKSAPWDGLTDVPSDLTDGDDDTHYSAGTGLSLVGTQFSIALVYRLPQGCANGAIAEWNNTSGAWDCGSDDVGSGAAAWLLGGNAGTTPGTDVMGTNDAVSLTLVVDAVPALRLEPATVPNLVGGDEANQITVGVVGATIGGGGNTSAPNRVTDDYGTVGGGAGNRAGDDNGGVTDATYATVGGGQNNIASGWNATVSGGISNTASFSATTVGGGNTNTASGAFCTVGGGRGNTASDTDATVGGGLGNVSSGARATIGGGRSNLASEGYATIGGGAGNTADGDYATVGGGHYNLVEGDYATIAGGGPSDPLNYTTTNNRVYDNYGTIGGGGGNKAGSDDDDSTNARYATIGGGYHNVVTGTYATVGGGQNNTASDWFATVGGGRSNIASSQDATIGGGAHNIASVNLATVSGGWGGVANGYAATIGGGLYNAITATYATIGGGWKNTITATYATIGGGRSNTVSGNLATIGGGDGNVVSADRATVGGGWNNTASGINATVAGGRDNTASGGQAAVGGGHGNTVTGGRSFIGSGYQNVVTATDATIGGGYQNVVTNTYATIGGGRWNRGWGVLATVGGGSSNVASGLAATVPGGYVNTAQGDYSFAAGRRAKANNQGCFAWGDSTDADVTCGVDNRWVARASGGVYFFTSSDQSTGVYLASGGETWEKVSSSDRNLKENFAVVDGQQILAQLADVPISTWNYKASESGALHIGPMAQDFYAAFGVGEDDKHLGALDVNGVALAAIQGLYAQNQALTTENAALQTRVDSLETEYAAQEEKLNDLEARLAALEQAGAPHPAQPIATWWLPLAGLTVLAGITVARQRRQGVER